MELKKRWWNKLKGKHSDKWICPKCGSSDVFGTSGWAGRQYPFDYDCGRCGYEVKIKNEKEEIKILVKVN